MEAADLLLILIVVVAVVAGVTGLSQRSRDNALRAASPPAAGVEPGDPIALVRAKNRNYRLLQEATRLFHEIIARDDLMPSLPEKTRSEVEAFLKEFYADPTD